MHKRFRKLENEAIRKHYRSSSSNATTVNINNSKLFAAEKCVRQKERQPIEVNISDSSTDEFDQKNQMEEENLRRYGRDPSPLKLAQHNSYQPLSVSSTAKSPSQPWTSNIFDISNCSTVSSAVSPAACRAAYNNFRQTLTAISRNQKGINKTSLDFTSIADDANTNLQRNKTFVSQKYMRQRRRNPIEVHISDTSSDELHKEGKLDEENHKRLPNLKRYSSDAKPLRLMQHNRYRPLPISITTKYQSQTKPSNIYDEANCSAESTSFSSAPNQEIMNKTLLDSTPITSLEANMERIVNKQQMDSTPITSLEANMERMVDKQQMDRTPITSLEANMERMIDKQQMSPKLIQKKQHCVKGGYVYEFNKVMLKERMDRRSLAQNKRLGISSRCRVQVLDIFESFGVKMAQVKPLEGVQDKGKFNIIISPMTVGGNISVGATVELYFDLKPETALKLPNNELVYVHPNKLVLL